VRVLWEVKNGAVLKRDLQSQQNVFRNQSHCGKGIRFLSYWLKKSDFLPAQEIGPEKGTALNTVSLSRATMTRQDEGVTKSTQKQSNRIWEPLFSTGWEQWLKG
jgi:hypothetical protein